MKKISTLLFCALALVLGTNSTHAAPKDIIVQKAPAAIGQVQKVQLESLKQAPIAQLQSVQPMSRHLSATPALKVNNRKAQAHIVRNGKSLKANLKANPAKAIVNKTRSAVDEPETITGVDLYMESDYIQILGDNNLFFIYFFNDAYQLDKKYSSLEDMYMVCTMTEEYEEDDATDFSIIITEKDGLTQIDATMTTQSGAEYVISYEEEAPAPPTGDTIYVSGTKVEFDDYYYDYYIFTEDGFYIFEMYDGEPQIGVTYTEDDMVLQYTGWYADEDGGYITAKADKAELTVNKTEADLLDVAGKMLINGTVHIISFKEKPFVPSGNKVNVDGTNLTSKYYSYYGMFIYSADCGDGWEIQLAFDATTEKATYTADDFIADYSILSSDNSTYVEFVKLASDITITTTDSTKTLAGSIYAKNGDEYVLNLVYEKPAAKEFNINVANATLTNKSTIGFWTIDGQTEDKNNSFMIYFISKALQGTFTNVDQFDAYSTWVSDMSSGSNVYYENISAVNLTSVIDGDSLKITGTMNLADYNGNPAIVTVYITTPFAQEWGEWEDFAPFDLNTGKYSFSAATSGTQTNIPVQVRKDNTGFKQYKFIGWGKQVFTAAGVDLIVDMAPDYTCTVAEQNTGLYQSAYSEYIMVSDLATYSPQDTPSAYDPETGTFELAMIYYISLGNFGFGYETFVMDKPIIERDTVDVMTNEMTYNDFIATDQAVQYYAGADAGYKTFCVTSMNASSVEGTFQAWANYCFATDAEGNNLYFQNGEFTVAAADKGIRLIGWMIGDDEKYYRLNWYKQTQFDVRDTLSFSGQSVSILECVNQTGAQTGWLYDLVDASTGYEFLLQSTVVADKYGHFSYADKTLGSNYYNVFDPQGNIQQFKEGSITVGEVGDSIILDGELIAEDEKVYILHFAQNINVLQYDTDAPFNATFAYNEMEASIEDGVISINATNAENQAISLELYTDPAATKIPAGTYVISDTQEAGTALKSVGVAGGYLTECWAGVRGTSGISDCWFMVDGIVTLYYDGYDKLNVMVNASNSYGQDVTATVKYERLQAKDTVAVNDASLSLIEDYMEEYGIVNFYCEGAEHAFDLYAYADTIYGDFTNIDYGDCEYYSIDGDSASILDVFELNVSAEGKNMTLKAQVLTSDTILYVVNATGYYGAFDFDTNADFNAEFSTENMTTKTITKSKKSCKIISAVNEAGDSVSILFRTSQMPAAGTYEINYTESVNTVIASDGDTFENVSLAVRSKDGGEPDIWFMVSGTVTIDELGNISVNALNSYDKAIKFTINVPKPEYYLYNYYYGKYLGWNGSSTDKNKIAMMDESDRMAVTVTLTDADNKRFTTSVTSTDDKAMYLSMGSGFNFHSGSPYAGEQDNGYWYKVKDITASSIEAEKVSEIEEGEFYIIVHNYNGYSALGGTVTDTDGNGKMRILGYSLPLADDKLTLNRADIIPYIYRYVTANTPAMDPPTSVKPVMQKNDDSIYNVAGQRILNPAKGNIYIINGKKTLFE